MIEIGGLSISLAEILGLLVTLLGIVLVVRQLREAKLASQMSGLLELGGRYEALLSVAIDEMTELAFSEEWQSLDASEARAQLFGDTQIRGKFSKMAAFYELLGVLVRSKALQEKMAFDYFGDFAPIRWAAFEKAVIEQRRSTGFDSLLENWEWLVKRFEKRKR